MGGRRVFRSFPLGLATLLLLSFRLSTTCTGAPLKVLEHRSQGIEIDLVQSIETVTSDGKSVFNTVSSTLRGVRVSLQFNQRLSHRNVSLAAVSVTCTNLGSTKPWPLIGLSDGHPTVSADVPFYVEHAALLAGLTSVCGTDDRKKAELFSIEGLSRSYHIAQGLGDLTRTTAPNELLFYAVDGSAATNEQSSPQLFASDTDFGNWNDCNCTIDVAFGQHGLRSVPIALGSVQPRQVVLFVHN